MSRGGCSLELELPIPHEARDRQLRFQLHSGREHAPGGCMQIFQWIGPTTERTVADNMIHAAEQYHWSKRVLVDIEPFGIELYIQEKLPLVVMLYVQERPRWGLLEHTPPPQPQPTKHHNQPPPPPPPPSFVALPWSDNRPKLRDLTVADWGGVHRDM
eukprot:gene18804-biopygen5657